MMLKGLSIQCSIVLSIPVPDIERVLASVGSHFCLKSSEKENDKTGSFDPFPDNRKSSHWLLALKEVFSFI